jgi:superfamily II helicase
MNIQKDLKKCHESKLRWKGLDDCIDHQRETAECKICKTIFERRDTGKVMYVKTESNEEYVCGTCGSEIMTEAVRHAVYEGLFALSNNGKWKYEIVRYCPECEGKPSFNGSPIKK